MPYGYVGADLNKGAVQVLNSQPWTSVILRGIDLCDRLFRSIVADALLKGYFVDAHGVKQYLSDAVVFLTAGETEEKRARPGFVTAAAGEQREDTRGHPEKLLGKGVTSQCQIVTQTGPADLAARGWLTQVALPALNERYARSGLGLEWDDSAVDWLVAAAGPEDGPEEWRSLLEARLGPRLADILYEEERRSARARIVVEGDGLAVLRRPA